MIVVVTGMVGVDKKSYLEGVCKYAAGRGDEVLLCNVGDMMYAEAPDIAPGKILDISMKRLSSLRRSVFKDIIARARETENVIVNTHATFRWRHGLFPAVDFDQMRQLNADMYTCLIDGVIALHTRLSAEHAVEHTLLSTFVDTSQTRRLQCLAQETGVAVQIGPHVDTTGAALVADTRSTTFSAIEANNSAGYSSISPASQQRASSESSGSRPKRGIPSCIVVCIAWLGPKTMIFVPHAGHTT